MQTPVIDIRLSLFNKTFRFYVGGSVKSNTESTTPAKSKSISKPKVLSKEETQKELQEISDSMPDVMPQDEELSSLDVPPELQPEEPETLESLKEQTKKIFDTINNLSTKNNK